MASCSGGTRRRGHDVDLVRLSRPRWRSKHCANSRRLSNSPSSFAYTRVRSRSGMNSFCRQLDDFRASGSKRARQQSSHSSPRIDAIAVSSLAEATYDSWPQFISLARFGRFGSARRPMVSSSVNFDLHRMRGCNPACDKKSSLHRPSAMRKEAEFAVPLRLFDMRFIAWPANRNRSPSGPQRFRWFESNSCHLGGLSLSLGVSAQRSSLSPALMRNSMYQQ